MTSKGFESKKKFVDFFFLFVPFLSCFCPYLVVVSLWSKLVGPVIRVRANHILVNFWPSNQIHLHFLIRDWLIFSIDEHFKQLQPTPILLKHDNSNINYFITYTTICRKKKEQKYPFFCYFYQYFFFFFFFKNTKRKNKIQYLNNTKQFIIIFFI